MTQGLAAMETVSPNIFRFREVDRTAAAITDVLLEERIVRGGVQKVRTLTILYALANGALSPKPGETIHARGLKLKVESTRSDTTSLTIACVDFDT